jgi:hypothetical protein
MIRRSHRRRPYTVKLFTERITDKAVRSDIHIDDTYTPRSQGCTGCIAPNRTSILVVAILAHDLQGGTFHGVVFKYILVLLLVRFVFSTPRMLEHTF